MKKLLFGFTSIATALGALLIAFQNCSSHQFSGSSDSNLDDVTAHNGQTYSGMVFEKSAPQGACADGQTVQGRLVFLSATRVGIDRKNCVDQLPPQLVDASLVVVSSNLTTATYENETYDVVSERLRMSCVGSAVSGSTQSSAWVETFTSSQSATGFTGRAYLQFTSGTNPTVAYDSGVVSSIEVCSSGSCITAAVNTAATIGFNVIGNGYNPPGPDNGIIANLAYTTGDHLALNSWQVVTTAQTTSSQLVPNIPTLVCYPPGQTP